MAHPTPYAEPVRSADAAVAQVRHALTSVMGPGSDDPAIVEAAREAVRELWDRPVRVFVPVLAARAVRDRFAPPPPPGPIPAASPAPVRTAPLDELVLDPRDALVSDPRDGLDLA